MKNIASTETRYNVAFVTIIVSDMQRSLDFYTGRLGLTLKTRYGDEFAVVEAPGVKIGLHPAKEGGAKAGSNSKRAAYPSRVTSSPTRRCDSPFSEIPTGSNSTWPNRANGCDAETNARSGGGIR